MSQEPVRYNSELQPSATGGWVEFDAYDALALRLQAAEAQLTATGHVPYLDRMDALARELAAAKAQWIATNAEYERVSKALTKTTQQLAAEREKVKGGEGDGS